MAYFPFQPGQQPMSSSLGVVIASDQSPVSVTGAVAVTSSVMVRGSVISLNGSSNTPADGLSNVSATAQVLDGAGGGRPGYKVFPHVFNGVGWDLVRGNSSVGTLVSTANQSVIAIIQGSVAVAVANQSVSGAITANQGTNAGLGSRWPVIISNGSQTVNVTASSMLSVTVDNVPTIAGSVVAFQGTNPWITIGSVQQGGTWIASVFGNMSVLGTVPVTQATTPWTIGSVYGNISGSVAATIVGTPNVNTAGSVVAFQGAGWSGSVAAFQAGTWKPSIAANYASNSASIVSALGVLTLGVRNDTLASVLAVADGSYGPFTVGQYGDQIVSVAPSTKWTAGSASLVTGVQLPIITSVLGTRINITGVQVANTSANNVYVSLYGAGLGSVVGSIIAYTVAPANGGSNINFPVPLQTAINAGLSASVSGVASVYVSAQGFFSKV